ncbi:S-adenosylmethionine:tRNA ribosyltransferase-isomerase [Rhodobacteraceae bacterium MBR-64]
MDGGGNGRGRDGMNLSDFDFDLPEALIATRPAQPRTAARLLVVDGAGTRDLGVRDLPKLLRAGDRLVLNNTRVIPARLSGLRVRPDAQRADPQAVAGARIEVTLLQPGPGGDWAALVRPLRKLRPGDVISFSDTFTAEVVARGEDRVHLRFNRTGADFDAALAAVGLMPLPPYIASRRQADARDRVDYQTVFARHSGAVAAPTASLHFDQALLADIVAAGVALTEVTLHVGAGTFLPVKVDDVTTHKMHAEWGEVGAAAADAINATRAAGGRVIAVGTTALRLIESAADAGGRVQPWQGETDIFIYPGYRFRVTDGLMTNFHLPKSTLMMLVSALMGTERMRAAYAHAISQGYRFFSYGDSSLLLPGDAGGR